MPSLYSREKKSLQVEEMPRWRRILHRATLTGPDYPSRRIAKQVTFFALLELSAVLAALGLILLLLASTLVGAFKAEKLAARVSQRLAQQGDLAELRRGQPRGTRQQMRPLGRVPAPGTQQ